MNGPVYRANLDIRKSSMYPNIEFVAVLLAPTYIFDVVVRLFVIVASCIKNPLINILKLFDPVPDLTTAK